MCVLARTSDRRALQVYIYIYVREHPQHPRGRQRKSKKPAAKNKKAFCLFLLWEASEAKQKQKASRQKQKGFLSFASAGGDTDRPPRDKQTTNRQTPASPGRVLPLAFFLFGERGAPKKKAKGRACQPAGEQNDLLTDPLAAWARKKPRKPQGYERQEDGGSLSHPSQSVSQSSGKSTFLRNCLVVSRKSPTFAAAVQANHSWLNDILWQNQEWRLTQCTQAVLVVTRSTCVMASR